MIKVEDLSFSYMHKPFIKDVSFEVKKGEIFVSVKDLVSRY